MKIISIPSISNFIGGYNTVQSIVLLLANKLIDVESMSNSFREDVLELIYSAKESSEEVASTSEFSVRLFAIDDEFIAEFNYILLKHNM